MAKIHAIDFDGYLCENAWPEIGAANIERIQYFKSRRQAGDKLILWTCREGQAQRDAVTWCAGQGLYFDAVNTNLPEMMELYGIDSRKIGADAYYDDKNASLELIRKCPYCEDGFYRDVLGSPCKYNYCPICGRFLPKREEEK